MLVSVLFETSGSYMVGNVLLDHHAISYRNFELCAKNRVLNFMYPKNKIFFANTLCMYMLTKGEKSSRIMTFYT